MSRKQTFQFVVIFTAWTSAILNSFRLTILDDESLFYLCGMLTLWVLARGKKDKKLKKSKRGIAKKWVAWDFLLVIVGAVMLISNAVFNFGMPPAAISAFFSGWSLFTKTKNIKDKYS